VSDDLFALQASIWAELEQAARDRSHGWRLLVLATRVGNEVDARNVILREADASSESLLFFTDARSPKVAQLHAHPRATLVAWCPRLNWQLRLQAQFTVETDGLDVSSRWARLQLSPAAQDYLSPLPPGSLLRGPAVPERSSRSHFALLRARVSAIDWTGLRSSGNRRAGFDVDGARWLTP
jgi:pyridoxamine 5'-phosphate oxidase